jgi:hypothetical protein
MMIFLILAPYGVFATLMLLVSPVISLLASAAVCLAVIARDALTGRSIKVLGAGSAVVFTALAGYIGLVDPAFTSAQVKLAADAGMLAIALGSLLLRRPFTLQYAREMTDPETARIGIPESQLCHNLGLGFGFRADGARQYTADLFAMAAAMDGNCDRIRGAKLRSVLHEMVSQLPANQATHREPVGIRST